MNDLISREAAIGVVSQEGCGICIQKIVDLPFEKAQQWIPCSEGVPKKIEPVNITWINRRPELYYIHIKDKPFTSTGIYCRGQWYWYSTECEDFLEEYGDYKEYEFDKISKDIDIIAWQPLPKPYVEVEE